MEKKDKINFDLDFLDKNTKEKPKEQPKSKDPNWVYHKDGPGGKSETRNPAPSSGGMSDNAKKWAWGIGIVVVISILSSLSGDSNTSTPSTTQPVSNSGGQVQVGHYMCSSYAASHADSIQPNSATLTALNAEYDRIDAMGAARKSEKADLDSTYVDETDQYQIDNYNTRVATYNASYQTYSNAYDSWEARKNTYNNSVDTYNNYLESNCTPN